ncbi:MAG: hypothetical protein ACJ73S_20630 [Mycobacteriales bacterium]
MERELSWSTLVVAVTAGTVAGVVLLSGWLLLRARTDSSPEAMSDPKAGPGVAVGSTAPPPSPIGLRDVVTGVSFPDPDPRWRDESLSGPHNAALAAGRWACEYRECYHGVLASGGPVTGADARTVAQREGDELHPEYVGKLRTETRLVSAAATVAGHPAWQVRWKLAPADPDTPPATAWLLAIDSGTRAAGGEQYDWVYGVVDDTDPGLQSSTFDTVMRTIGISPR